MGYNQCWKWETSIADASLFAAWSRDVEQLRTYLATPGILVPSEGPRILSEEQLRILLARSPEALHTLDQQVQQVKEWQLKGWPGINIQFVDTENPPDPEPFPPLIIRGPDGTGEPLFTPTEVAFNGDISTDDHGESFLITFQDLEAPYSWSCKTRKCPYDLLVICALVRLAHYFPTICVYSDGGKTAVERGMNICQQVFGDITFPRWCFGNNEEEDQLSSI